MIKSCANKETESLFRTGSSKRLAPEITRSALRKLDLLHSVAAVEELKNPPGNGLHALSGDEVGKHSISINMQWRICFTFEDGNAYDVEICDYH